MSRSSDRSNRTRSVWSPSSCRLIVMTTLPRFWTRSVPFTSLITPRGAGTSIRRTALSLASALYCSAASTCKNHSRVVSVANIARTSAARTFTRRPIRGSVMRSRPPSPSGDATRTRPLGGTAQQREHERSQDRVVDRGEKRHAEQVEPADAELAEQEGHDPVEHDAGERPAGDQQDR